jgi:light-regulated signal transduction histidine kinase (bacteriophytochrome)
MTTNPAIPSMDLGVCSAFVAIAEADVCPGEPVAAIPDYVALAHVALQPVPLDLSLLAATRIESLRELEPHRHVEVIVHRRMLATGDAALLSEVLAQLIDNAWTATSGTRSAWIEIGTRMASDGERQFYVADNGAGFDMVLAGALFEPPMSRYREDTCSGQGKGLARAARIIRRHAGRLQADAAPGMGAEFYFTVGTTPPSAGALDA